MKALLVYPEYSGGFFPPREAMALVGRTASTPPLGLMTMAALLPDEWELRLVDEAVRKLEEDDWHWAEMVMISGMVVHQRRIYHLIHEAKQRGKIVVVGGPYATSLPEEVLNAGADYVIKGEAENTVPLWLEALPGTTRRIFENPEKPDMTDSPMPRFDLVRSEDYTEMSIQTCRGCPHGCEFCDIEILHGRHPRYKSADQLIAELQSLYSLGCRGSVFIADDNFIGNKARARDFLRRIASWNRARNQPFGFWCQASMDLGLDNELIDLMTAANFGYVFVGIESTDEEVLRRTHKYQNIRNPIIDSLNNIRNNGLSVLGSFIIGFDGEQKGVDDRIISLVEATDMPQIMVNVLNAIHYSKMGLRMIEEGRLLNHLISGDTIFSKPNFIPTRPQSEILEEHRRVYVHLYEPSRYLTRAYRYVLGTRPTRKAMALAKGETPNSTPKDPVPLKTKLTDVRAFFQLAWRLGIKPSYRFQFWRQLIGVMRKNPSRLDKFFFYCAIGLDMFRLRDTFLNEIVSADTYREQPSSLETFVEPESEMHERSEPDPVSKVS